MRRADWWQQPRTVSVVVDNQGWGQSWGQELARRLQASGDDAVFLERQEEVRPGGVAIFLSCLRLTRPEILARNHRNLVVHASDLPRGRGFSPWTWQVLEGAREIPACLIEAAEGADEGALIYKDWIALQGDELVDDLRELIGRKSVELCERFLAEKGPPPGRPQKGEPTWYPRRRPDDSRLDVSKTLEEQFDLLRVVDNEDYPAFFDYRGSRYVLKIGKLP